MSNARKVLHQDKIPENYWDYALAHVTACKNIMPDSKTKYIPNVRLLIKQSEELLHIRRFCFQMMYQPVQGRLENFKPHLYEGI